MDPWLENFLGALVTTTTPEEAWSALRGFLARYDVETVNYGVGPVEGVASGADVEYMTTLPETWMEEYVATDLARGDHALWHCMQALTPVATGIAKADDLGLGELERHFLRAAEAETGLKTGLCVPVRSARPRQLGGVSLGTRLPKDTFDRIIAEHGASIHIAILHFHVHAQTLRQREATADAPLSARERECLLWLGRGLRPDQIADRLGLARVTVDLHLRGARRKLKAATREHALAIAVSQGLIAP